MSSFFARDETKASISSAACSNFWLLLCAFMAPPAFMALFIRVFGGITPDGVMLLDRACSDEPERCWRHGNTI